jgi:putative cardiolipin synthase
MLNACRRGRVGRSMRQNFVSKQSFLTFPVHYFSSGNKFAVVKKVYKRAFYLVALFFFGCYFPIAALAIFPPDSSSIYKSLRLQEENLKHNTGIMLLEYGEGSLITRLWLLTEAKHSIDIQYFSFARNLTGLIACDYLVRAADRGVKVRLLVDELSGKMNSREIKILDRHENIEVRVYNAGIRVGRADKKLKYLIRNRRRLTRRMHNKTFTIDGQAAIIGGRNISDEYFDFDGKFNFRDRDVLLLGKTAKDVEKSFMDFWNSPLTVACSELVGGTNKKFSIDALFAKLHEFKSDTARFSKRIRERVDSFPLSFKKCISTGDFQFANSVSFVSDIPGKNEDRKNRNGGICDDTIVSLIKKAKSSIDVQTPYFITTDEARSLLKETVDRGVRVKVLTNSMASIDNLIAFSPYKRDRKRNFKTGIDLYEFRPDAAERFTIMSAERQAEFHYDPVIGLHSKSLIIDDHISVIGSYNLTPRSVNLNSECVVVIRSKQISDKLSEYFHEEFLPRNSWHVTKIFNPDKKASLKRKIKVFFGHLVPKKAL